MPGATQLFDCRDEVEWSGYPAATLGTCRKSRLPLRGDLSNHISCKTSSCPGSPWLPRGYECTGKAAKRAQNLQSAEGQLDSVQSFLYLIRFEVVLASAINFAFPSSRNNPPSDCLSQPALWDSTKQATSEHHRCAWVRLQRITQEMNSWSR